MRSTRRSSVGSRPTAARRSWPTRCRRSAPTARGSPSELDGQTARARQLETANREIAHRLDAAIDNIRSVLGERSSQ